MKFIRVSSILTIMWCYAGITGFSPSVLRASVMFSFIVFGKEWRRKINIYNSVAASAVVLLIANPKLLFNPGFQLSYSAVIGIVAFYPLINRCWFPPTKWLADLWNLLCVSLVAQLATLPFSLFYFQQFPTYFWLANLAVIPLIPIILAGGILYLGIAFIPYINQIWAYILDFVVQFVLSTAELTSSLPSAVIQHIFIAPWQFVLLIGSLLSALIFVQRAEKKWLVISLVFAIAVPIGGLYTRFQHSKEIEIVYYAAQDNLGHASFRIGENVVVIGDTAATFFWRGLQTSNYVNQVWRIPFKHDTVLPRLNFEKRGSVVHFRNNFYRLNSDRDNSFWYQVAPLKGRNDVSTTNYKPMGNEVFILRL